MDKSRINYFVDALMTFTFLITAITGLIIFFFLPSGIKQGRYQTFLGITKGTWSFIHNWSGIIFIVLLLIHLILHWKWIVTMTKSIFKRKIERR
ncbi:MAG: DUF4405 domain-containing protein [Candidatus Pacearchaeota archaeon]